MAVRECIDESFKHDMHGKPGSHEGTEQKHIGGSRGAVQLGNPDEQEKHVVQKQAKNK